MSLSWIKNITREEIHTRRTLGVEFGSSHIRAVLMAQGKKAGRVEWHETLSLETPFFVNQPNSSHGEILKSFLDRLNTRIQDKYVRVQVFLPDPVALYGFYNIDSVPDKPAQCRQLACWRIGKQFHVQDKAWVCDYQLLGEMGRKKFMLAVAMDAAWLSFIRDNLYAKGILAPLIDTRISHHFNQLGKGIKQDSGALIDMTEDYWSLMAWDNQGRPRLVRSCWRNKDDKARDADLTGIAQEIIESLLIYCNEAADTQISAIYIFGSGHAGKALGEILNQHMTHAVKYFDLPQAGMVDSNTPDAMQMQTRDCTAAIPR